MKKVLLIFDFDGTIANSWIVAGQILSEVGAEYSLPSVPEHRLKELKGKRIRELLQLSGLRWWQLPRFVQKARKRFKVHMEKVPPIHGMPEVLSSLRQKGFRMGILTSNSESVVRTFIQQHQLGHFEFIKAPSSIFGKSRVIKQILKYGNLEKEAVVMIGDEARDIQAAKKAGVDSVAVCWGFNSEDLLRSCHPTHIVHHPSDLEAYFSQSISEFPI